MNLSTFHKLDSPVKDQYIIDRGSSVNQIEINMSLKKFAVIFIITSVFFALHLIVVESRDQRRDTGTSAPNSRAASLASFLTEHEGNLVNQPYSNSSIFHVQVTAIHVDKSEFPLSKLLFRLTLKLAIDELKSKLEAKRVKLSLSVRSASTCSQQYAGAVAAEEYYRKKARLFIVSGCDGAIRSVSKLSSTWRVPVLTAAGFGADLSDKTVHKTLIRVAFSFKTAVEFLIKIMKMFQWKRVNLIVDESDSNSVVIKESIEGHLENYKAGDFQITSNVIPLDLQTLSGASLNSTNSSMIMEDGWPNNVTELAVHDALRQSSLFSRINILLISQRHLRKFMLSVYNQNMANGLYSFINVPLLLMASDEIQQDNSGSSKQSYSISTGENIFIWRSPFSTRNSQAKKSFESLMSIHLKIPTTKNYTYFANKLSNLANTEFATTSQAKGQPSSRSQLNVNPYTAAFYDCFQIYSTVLVESLAAIQNATDKATRKKLKAELHSRISDSIRNRRYDNMVTGSILINENGDRETEYTLDDLNQMTGMFQPVILYKSVSKDIDRIARIQWSSDESVGPTVDIVDCQLTNSCPRKPLSRFMITFLLFAAPLSLIMGFVLYFVYKYIRLESQLVDYWWRINYKEIEMVATRRKNLGNGSSVVSGADSHTSSHGKRQIEAGSEPGTDGVSEGPRTGRSLDIAKTTITKVTDTSANVSSAADLCYGDITLGIYKLNKVALKPMAKFHQSRKLMIELRTIKGISHNNLCRFVGIIVDEPHTSLVNEFCPKGSLREFFQNESMVIDWTFKYSIINDIMSGLMYLHSSDLGFYGRLKSGNCLVSSRFVVKLSDYGLHSLYELIDENEDDINLMKKELWMAPEHLKSGSKNGSKAGDVYSFGLLLYEIITNNIPFFNSEKNDYIMPLQSLISKLKSTGPSDEIGPDLSVIEAVENKIELLVELMQKCWQFEAAKRPSLLVVHTALKKITSGITSKKLLENLTCRMEQYTSNLESLVDAKLANLMEEKMKAEEILYQFVPKSIAGLLKEGQSVEPEAFDCVTVFFSDIVGFTSLSSESTPIEVIDFLRELYQCFDETLERYDIFKVDTIGDAYIVASGLPERNEGKHVIEICRAAIELRDRIASFKIAHKPGRNLEMRVGIHSGPCTAGIVGGVNMPKYCVFGDTLSVGKFMESSGKPMEIHVTEQSKKLLDDIGGFKIEPRVPKVTKDGIPFQTYWLKGELSSMIH